MKATELRIGNFVLGTFDTPATIESDDFERLEEEKNYCRPVPITEGWLFKLGFKRDENKPFYYIKIEEYNIELTANAFSNHEDGEYYVSIVAYNNKCTFKKRYVHQLQNLYFALTDKELTAIN